MNPLLSHHGTFEFNFGDHRLNERCRQISQTFQSTDLREGFPTIFPTAKELKGFYRLVNNSKVNSYKIIESNRPLLSDFIHGQARQTSKPVKLLAYEDSTAAKYKEREKLDLGYLQTNSSKDNGVMIHTMIACNEQWHPLGILDQQFIQRNRDEYGKSSTRSKRSFEDKESFKWVKPLANLSGWRNELPDHQFILVMDREGDILEVMNHCIERGAEFIIRSRHNRKLSGENQGHKLHDYLVEQDVLGQGRANRQLHSRRSNRYYEVECTIRYARFSVKGTKQELGAVYLEEDITTRPHGIGGPAAQWFIVTSLPVENSTQATQVLDDYAKRWPVTEDFHKALKTGARIEQRQFDSAPPLFNAISLLSLISVRLLALRHIADTTPNLPVKDSIWGEDELLVKLLPRLDEEHLSNRDRDFSEPATVKRLIQIVGRMAGHLGYAQKGPPGWKLLYIGTQRLTTLLDNLKRYG